MLLLLNIIFIIYNKEGFKGRETQLIYIQYICCVGWCLNSPSLQINTAG